MKATTPEEAYREAAGAFKRRFRATMKGARKLPLDEVFPYLEAELRRHVAHVGQMGGEEDSDTSEGDSSRGSSG